MEEWPRLSWLTRCSKEDNRIVVLHGRDVECGSSWFCEAIWNGPFEEGAFDETDIIFGSGGRMHTSGIVFVSSLATTDRLHYILNDGELVISNSLPAIINSAGGCPDPTYRGYAELFKEVANGLEFCQFEVPLIQGAVHVVHNHNLRWDGSGVQILNKPRPIRDLSSYENYIRFMNSQLKLLRINMESSERKFTFSWMGALTQGYDSPAVCAMAQKAGLSEAIWIDQDWPGVKDDGTVIGNELGIETHTYHRSGWSSRTPFNPLFVGTDGQGKELLIALAQSNLSRKAFATGYGSNLMWNPDYNAVEGEATLHRQSYSGSSMTEYRLHSGFIHVVVPLMGAFQNYDVLRITRSELMKKWDIGQKYSKPIPRRYLEELGIERNLFGIEKFGGAWRFIIGEYSWPRGALGQYLNWLWTNNMAMSNLDRLMVSALHLLYWPILKIVDRVPHRRAKKLRRALFRVNSLWHRWGIRDYPFIWGLEHSMGYYPDAEKVLKDS